MTWEIYISQFPLTLAYSVSLFKLFTVSPIPTLDLLIEILLQLFEDTFP